MSSKRKRRGRATGARAGGALMRMRQGFKRAAQGTGRNEPAARSRLGTALTVILLVAAAFLLFRRFG